MYYVYNMYMHMSRCQQDLSICMYMYVCMNVCLWYVFMYVCMYVRRTEVNLCICIYYVLYICVCMYVCMLCMHSIRSRGDGSIVRSALPGQAAYGPEHARIVRARGRIFRDTPGLHRGCSLPIHRRQDRIRHIHTAIDTGPGEG
jgi:hypothetical protein